MAYFFYLFDCSDRDTIIENGGQIVENDNGSVSVYNQNNGSLTSTPITKYCCELLDSTYTWDLDNQQCRWGAGCEGNIKPFKVVLNPKGNDGVIFSVDNNNDEVCTLDISFDYLFQLDCDDVVTTLMGNHSTNSLTNIELIQLNELQEEYDDCIRRKIILESELNFTILQLESTPYVIQCNKTLNGGLEPTGNPTGNPTGKPVRFTPNTIESQKLPVNFIPPNAILLFGMNNLCLTDLGLQQWELILGANRYNAWINSYATDLTQYGCSDVVALDVLNNNTGTLFGTCEVSITARQELENRISVIRKTLLDYDCDSILAQINGLQGDGPCSTVTEILETLNICMTLELVNPNTGDLETIYEQSIFNIGVGNLGQYLTNSQPNTGLLSTGDTTLNNCEILAINLMDELSQQLPSSGVTEIQNLVQNSLDSEWLNFTTNITDQSILNMIYNQKIKISFMIKDCCVDFGILVDRIKLDRNCSNITSTELTISKSPSFEMIRIPDNKKSWLANEDFKHRDFDLKYRQTEYDINNYKLAINSKEVDLDINPANAIEQDLFCYVVDNPCLLTGTTEISGVTCGDNGIDLNDLLSTELSAITTLNSFVKAISSELIFVSGWRTMSSYPTLKLLYDRYMNSTDYCDTVSSQFGYLDMIQFSELVGTYWVDLIEQVVPSTTIWGSTYVYGNTLWDQQKFKYKKYY